MGVCLYEFEYIAINFPSLYTQCQRIKKNTDSQIPTYSRDNFLAEGQMTEGTEDLEVKVFTRSSPI